MMISLTDAFLATYQLVEDFYHETSSNSVVALLSDMLFFDDDSTADPAAWGNWLHAVQAATGRGSCTDVPLGTAILISVDEAYEAAMHYLAVYADRTLAAEIAVLVEAMRADHSTGARWWNTWREKLEHLLRRKPQTLPRLCSGRWE